MRCLYYSPSKLQKLLKQWLNISMRLSYSIYMGFSNCNCLTACFVKPIDMKGKRYVASNDIMHKHTFSLSTFSFSWKKTKLRKSKRFSFSLRACPFCIEPKFHIVRCCSVRDLSSYAWCMTALSLLHRIRVTWNFPICMEYIFCTRQTKKNRFVFCHVLPKIYQHYRKMKYVGLHRAWVGLRTEYTMHE